MRTYTHAQEAACQPLSLAPVQRMRRHYENRAYQALTAEILSFFRQLDAPRTVPFSPEEKQILALSMQLIILFMQDETYHITAQDACHLVTYAAVLGGAMQLAGMGTTDAVLEKLQSRPDRRAQQLLLCSLYNTVEIDLAHAARQDARIVSLWWDKLLEKHRPFLDPALHRRALRLLEHPVIAERFTYVQDGQSLATNAGFFCSSYLNYKADKKVRGFLNAGIRRSLQRYLGYQPDLAAQTQPRDFNTIVVMSTLYYPPHALYRSISPLIKSLHGHYRTVLVGMLNPQIQDTRAFDTADFDAHYWFADYEDAFRSVLEEIRPGLIIHTDVGMTNVSLLAANVRLAPIQITGYGHPLTTASPDIDYYVGSADAERPELAHEHFTEKLVLIPGLAATPLLPDYQPCGMMPDEAEGIYISLAWGRHKLNRAFLDTLLPLARRVSRPVIWCLSGIDANNLAFLQLREELDMLIGATHYRLIAYMDEAQYFPLIEACHFGIDAHPFGSYNRIVDSLHCRRPILVKEGDHFINRAGACMLRQLGLEELVARDNSELLDKAVRLVDDTAYRRALSERIGAMDLEATLREHNPPEAYRHAIEAILADYHAGNIQDKTPIVMTQDMRR